MDSMYAYTHGASSVALLGETFVAIRIIGLPIRSFTTES